VSTRAYFGKIRQDKELVNFFFEETPHSLLIELVIRITNVLNRSKQPDMPT
jgi:hypothetical protein